MLAALIGPAMTWSAAARLGASGQTPKAQAGGVEALLGSALHQEEVEGNLRAAIAAYERVLKAPGVTRTQAARAYLHIGLCYERLGLAEARKAFETVVTQYRDQADFAVQARSRLNGLQSRTTRAAAAAPEPAPTLIPVSDAAFFARSISPDGRYLLGFLGVDLNNHVALELATGATRPVTHGAPCVSPGVPCDLSGPAVWSPDSKLIAYTWKPATGAWTVRVSELSGAVTRELKVGNRPNVLDWSDDGSAILVLRDAHPSWTLQVLSLDDQLRTVAAQLTWPVKGKLSRQKRFIVINEVRQGRDNATHLRLLNLERETSVALLDEDVPCEVVAWTPDDDGVLFQSTRGGSQGLWILPLVDGAPAGEPRLVRRLAGRVPWSVLLADGSIVYQQYSVSGGLQVVDVDVQSGSVLQAARPLLPQYNDRMTSPVWSPDGKALAFYSEGNQDVRSLFAVLNIWRPETGERQRIIPPFVMSGTPVTWSGDSSRLYVHGRAADGTGKGIYTLLASSGQIVDKVLSSVVGLGAVTADGRTAFEGTRPPALSGDVVRIDLTNGETRTVFHDEHRRFVGRLVLSPDQSRLLVPLSGSTSDPTVPSSVMAVPVGGGVPLEVYRATTSERVSTAVWMPDGKGLLVRTVRSEPNEPSTNRIFYVAVGEGSPTVVGLDATFVQAAIHPDGRRIVFPSLSSTDAQIWKLDGVITAGKAKARSQGSQEW